MRIAAPEDANADTHALRPSRRPQVGRSYAIGWSRPNGLRRPAPA